MEKQSGKPAHERNEWNTHPSDDAKQIVALAKQGGYAEWAFRSAKATSI